MHVAMHGQIGRHSLGLGSGLPCRWSRDVGNDLGFPEFGRFSTGHFGPASPFDESPALTVELQALFPFVVSSVSRSQELLVDGSPNHGAAVPAKGSTLHDT
jgi:hypothetical protein